jgi:hypothetical protein
MCVIKPLQAIGNLVLKAMEALSTYWFLLLDRIGDALNVIGKKSSDITHSVAKTFAVAIDTVVVQPSQAAAKVVWGVLSSVGRMVWDVLSLIASMIWRVILKPVLDVTTQVLHAMLYRLLRALTWFGDIFLAPFFKKYWRLLPALAALMGGILFAKIFAARTFLRPEHRLEVVSNAGFFFGSYTMFLIAAVLVHSVYSARNRMRLSPTISVSGSVLKYADLFVIDISVWAARNASHLLAELCRMLFRILGIISGQFLSRGLTLLKQLYVRSMGPLLRFLRRIFSVIWNSPFMSLCASLGIIVLVYLNETGQIRVGQYIWFPSGMTQGLETLRHPAANAMSLLTELFWGAHEILIPFVWEATAAVEGQSTSMMKALEAPTAESPHLAWFSYVFSVSLVKTQDHVKVKHLGIPVLTLPLCYFFPTIAKWSFPIFWFNICWILVSSFVIAPRQARQRHDNGTAFTQYQQEKRKKNDKPSKHLQELVDNGDVQELFGQTECVVCMEDFEKARRGRGGWGLVGICFLLSYVHSVIFPSPVLFLLLGRRNHSACMWSQLSYSLY